jgi:hypothetical protein
MEQMTLSFGVMLGFLQRAIAEIKDARLASNATRYSIKDTVLSAFSVFFMQCESFLEHQRQMHSRLASLLLTLNLLSFLFHTVLHLVDKPYQQIRFPTRLDLLNHQLQSRNSLLQ